MAKFKKNFEPKLGSLTNSIQMAEGGERRSKKIVIDSHEDEVQPR